jgi:hypothetical protein
MEELMGVDDFRLRFVTWVISQCCKVFYCFGSVLFSDFPLDKSQMSVAGLLADIAVP